MVCIAQPTFAADWLEAESDHYVVTAKLDGDQLRSVVRQMEDFDWLLEAQLPSQTRSQRKARIFLEDDYATISKVTPVTVSGWAYNHPEMAGSYSSYKPGENPASRLYSIFHAQTVLFTENSFIRPNAWWVRQGVSSFYATVYRDDDGNFIVGAPDLLRPLRTRVSGSELANMLMIERTPRSQSRFEDYSLISREAATALLINFDNAGIMESYLDAFGQGISLEQAGEKIGDLDALARQINLRASSPTKSVLQIPAPPRAPTNITVRQLGKDEIALIELRLQRLSDRRRETTARKLSRLTEDYSESAEVWYEYAAAEYALVQEADFGGEPVFRGFGFSNGELIVSANRIRYSDEKAWAAVNRALELRPEYAAANRLKAEILMARSLRAPDDYTDADFDTVRMLLAPFASEPELYPLAAAVFFQSFVEQGLTPPQSALDGLGRAFVTNPGVGAFRYAYAVALARQGQADAAEQLLVSMLNHPEFKEAAQRALTQTP